MTDIFLSYAHEDRDRVIPLVSELQEQGWKVWWDADIRTGVSFDDEIADALRSARCVLVVWSQNSINSQWVRSEAHEGLDKNKMVPILIDDVRPPIPFRQIQSRELFNLPVKASFLESGLLEDIHQAFEGRTDLDREPAKKYGTTNAIKRPAFWQVVLIAVLIAIFALLLWSNLVPDRPGIDQSVRTEYLEQQPAIALANRYRIVVANMQNLSGDEIFDESLDHAFRVGLSQSRIASVLSDFEINRVLLRMKLPADTPVNREVAMEVALREKARAVVLPSINRVGETYVVSVEIVNPANAQTIFTETEESPERNQVIAALGQLILSVREQLGESLSSSDESNLALEKVTTADIEALKAYSTALSPDTQGEQDSPIQLLLWAVNRDPNFAMAHAKLAAMYSTVDNGYKNAQKHWALALQHSERLTERERVYIQASSSWGRPPAERVRAWKLMATLFPEEVVGHHNLAMVYWEDQNRFEEAAISMRKAAVIDHPWQFFSTHSLGNILLGMGEYEESLKWFKASFDAEGFPLDFGMVDVFLVLGRYDDALEHLSKGAAIDHSEESLQRDQKRVGLMLEQGRLDESAGFVKQQIELARSLRLQATEQRYAVALLAILEKSGDANAFGSTLRDLVSVQMEMLSQDTWDMRFSPISTLAILGKVAARNGHPEIAREILIEIEPDADQSGFFFRQAYFDLLKAELFLLDGRPDWAIKQVNIVLNTGSLFQAHETLARAYEVSNEPDLAIREYLWLIQHHGQALAENMFKFYGRELSQLDRILAFYHVARLYEVVGNDGLAVEYYEKFIAQWKNLDITHWALTLAKERVDSLTSNQGG